LLNKLKSYEVSKTKNDAAKRARNKMGTLASSLNFKDFNDPEMGDVINGKNKATGSLFKWCRATLKCFDIYKKVEPLKLKAEKMKKDKEQGEKELAQTEKELAILNKSLAELNAGMKVKKDELDELERVSSEMTRKLTAASTLITGLAGE
jgi:septal ring factor EnvC (AmiA/AmiB activator)